MGAQTHSRERLPAARLQPEVGGAAAADPRPLLHARARVGPEARRLAAAAGRGAALHLRSDANRLLCIVDSLNLEWGIRP